MQERSVRRAAAIGGVLSVVFAVVGLGLLLGAPTPDKPAVTIVRWYADNRAAVFTSGLLAALSTVAILWFLGYLHHLLSSTTGATRALSSILLASGVATAGMATVTVLPAIALALAAGRPGAAPSDETVHLLDDLNHLSISVVSISSGLVLAVLGLLLTDGALSPRWASRVAYAGATLSLVGGGAAFFPSKTGQLNPGVFAALLGLALLLITISGISIELWRDRADNGL